MIIGIDFDGTCVSHEFPAIGQTNPQAIHYMKRFTELGAKLILFTMRSDRGYGQNHLTEAKDYLESAGVEMWGYNENPEQHHWTSSPKPYCNLYLDDAGFNCPLHHPEHFARPAADWSIIGPIVEQMLITQGVKQ